jgi:hypothetical protein
MLKCCDHLSCPEEYTYITSGLRAGVRELYRFYRENPSGEHVLVLMSDGVNHPPENVDEDDVVTYDAIKESFFSNFQPGKDWYVNYVALKGIPDKVLADFVRECRGTTVEIHADKQSPIISEARIYPGPGLQVDENNTINLGSALLPIKLSIPLLIHPLRGNLEGRRIKVEPILTNIGKETQLITDATPSEIECAATPKEVQITLSIDGFWDKTLNGALWFEPIGSSIFIIHPSQLQFMFDEPPKLKVHIGYYKPALGDYSWDPIDWLALGPLEPGGTVKETLALKVDGSLPPKGLDIEVTPAIELPSGVTCTASANVRLSRFVGQEAHVSVVVEAGEDAHLPKGKMWDGNLVLSCPTASLLFSRNPVPLRVFSEKLEVGGTWRDRIRSYYRELHLGEWLGENWKWLGLVIGALSLFVGLLFGVVYRRWKAYMDKFVPAEGWLIVLEQPDGSKVENIDLRVLSEKLKKSRLSVGSAPSSDIHIPHESVDKRHAEIRSGREGMPTPVYIRGLELSDVKVNNFVEDEEVKLQDRDIIDIGAYQFIYSNSHLKQVVVHYKDGDVRYGIPLTWNIEEEGFLLRPEGKGSAELQIYIPFRDLKSVFFVKDFDKEIARRMKFSSIYAQKDHIIIEFRDGEKIDGYTVRDYDPKASRFFMVPKVEVEKEENNICILVERRFTKKIKVLGKQA